MIKKGIIKAFNSGTYKATVQIAGSLSVWLEGIPVSRDIASGEMIAGRKCIVIFPDESNPQDAVVLAVYS